MSDQKPVKRDAAWLAAVSALITEHGMAVISFHQKQIPAEVLFAKRQAIDAMLLAPDLLEALRCVIRSGIEDNLACSHGDQIEALQKVKAAIAKATGAVQ